MSIGVRIHASPTPPAKGLVERLARLSTTQVADSMAFVGSESITPRHRAGKLCGPAITVRTSPGDNLLVQKVLDLARPGDVVVVAGGGYGGRAVVGELMSRYAISRGIAGFVVDGAVRDLDYIESAGFPVFSRFVTPWGPTRQGTGEINGEIEVAGVPVCPGDLILGDLDGVVVVPLRSTVDVLERAEQLARREEELMQAIAAGTSDRRWIDEALAKIGAGPK